VTSVVEAPAATPVPAGPSRPSRQWPWYATAAAAVLAGLVWSALLWAPTTLDVGAGQTGFGGTADVVTLDHYGTRGTHVVDYRHGADVSITVPLRNDGPLPITVTSVATGAGVFPLLEVVDVPGLPLELGPGEQGDVVLEAVLGNCRYYHEREVQNVDGLVVGAEVLGRSASTSVALDSPLLIHSPMIVGCPDRMLNRQYYNRSDAL
jgi:hypothetical protein